MLSDYFTFTSDKHIFVPPICIETRQIYPRISKSLGHILDYTLDQCQNITILEFIKLLNSNRDRGKNTVKRSMSNPIQKFNSINPTKKEITSYNNMQLNKRKCCCIL